MPLPGWTVGALQADVWLFRCQPRPNNLSHLALLTNAATSSQVGTPVTAAIRYREGAQLLALGLSPYAGAAFHGPPLLLAGAQAVDALGRKALGPGFSVLAAPWRTLATSAVDVAAAAALAALARSAAPPSKARSGTKLAGGQF